MFRKSYSSQSIISADIERVWHALTDFQAYHLWNTFTPKIESTLDIGNKVVLTVQMNKGKKTLLQTEYLTRLEPPATIAWGITWGVFLKAERIQKLTKDPDGRTSYLNEDIIHGILCPIVHWFYGKQIQRGFDEVALGLKKYVESPES